MAYEDRGTIQVRGFLPRVCSLQKGKSFLPWTTRKEIVRFSLFFMFRKKENIMIGTPIDVEGIYSYRENLQISHAVRAGNTIYLSGQVALDPEGNVVGQGNAEVQAEYIWGNIEKILEESGSGLDEIVKISVFGVGTDSTKGAWEVRKRMILGKDPLPCVTSVAVSGLFRPDLLLEIDVIAVTGN